MNGEGGIVNFFESPLTPRPDEEGTVFGTPSTPPPGAGEGPTPVPGGVTSGGEAGSLFGTIISGVRRVGTTIENLFGQFLKGTGGRVPSGPNRFPDSFATLFPSIGARPAGATVNPLILLLVVGVVLLLVIRVIR